MPDLWELPGYDVLELVGFGATGEVWRARETATGETVAVKRLRPGADPEAVASLRREAALLRSLDTPYVVRLRALLGEGERTVLVLDHAGGGSLAALLLHRGRLDPGEVVTVAVPVAEALAVAHARGLVHGDVSPSNVLFTSQGMPLLSDLGVARVAAGPLGAVDGTAEYVDPAVAAGGDPTPASDVWALAAVCHHLLAGSPPHEGQTVQEVLASAAAGSRAPLGLLAPTTPRPLVAAVESALVADPAARPDAAGFAVALRRAHSATPVRLHGAPAAAAQADPVRETHRVRDAPLQVGGAEGSGRRRPAWLLGVAAAVAVLLAAAVVGWRLGQDDVAPPAPLAPQAAARPSATAGTPDWRAVLDRLDAARAAAFAAGDPGALTGTYAPGSPALAGDTAVLRELAAQGRTARGVRHRLRSVRQTAFDGTTARLRVRDVLEPYEVLGPDGAVVEERPARAEADFEVVVVRTGAGFRLREVRAL